MLRKRQFEEHNSFGTSNPKSKRSKYNSSQSSRGGGSGVLSHLNSNSRGGDNNNRTEWDYFWQNVENSTYDSSSGADSSMDHSDPYVDDDNDDDDGTSGVPDLDRRIINEDSHFNPRKTILPPKTNRNTRNKPRSRAKQSKNKKQTRKKQPNKSQRNIRRSNDSENEVDKDGNEYLDDNDDDNGGEQVQQGDINIVISPEQQQQEEEEELEPKATFSPNFAEVKKKLGELEEGEECFGCEMGRLNCPASGMSAWNDLTNLYFHTASLCTPAEVCKHLWKYYENNIRIPAQRSDRYSRQLPTWSKRMIYEHYWGHVTHPVFVSEQIRMELAQITRNHLKYNVWEKLPLSNDIVNAATLPYCNNNNNSGNQIQRRQLKEYDLSYNNNTVRVRGDAKSVAALNRTVTTFLRVKEPTDYAEARQIELKPPKTNNVYLDPRSINYVSNVTKF